MNGPSQPRPRDDRSEAERLRSRNVRTFRAVVLQAALVAAVAALIWVLAHNAFVNMRTRGIPTDFSFWDQPAGFNVNQTLIPFNSATSTYGDAFYVGLLNTLLVSALGIVCATVVGVVVGVARLSPNFLVSKLAELYVEVFRNVPLLLQLLFWYNAVLKPLPAPRASVSLFGAVFLNNRGLALPRLLFGSGSAWIASAFLIGAALSVVCVIVSNKLRARRGRGWPVLAICPGLVVGAPTLVYFLTGRPIGLEVPVLHGFNFAGGSHVAPELAALLLGLTSYTASFIAEVVRSGIAAVDRGQIEAARALGLRRRHIFRMVVAPQAMRVAIPPLTNQYLNIIKNSSLAVFIGYPDLVQVFAGTVLNQTGAAIQVIAITMAIYLAISLATSWIMNAFNLRMAIKER